jgi:hypothetical protein
MNGTEAVVLLFFMGVFAVTAKIAHGVKKGDIVMVKPTLSAIAEGLGLKTETEYDAPYWLQIVHAHGTEKALRGVVNTLKNGGQLVAEVNVFALYNKGVREMNAIPWRIGKKLAQLNTHFECGCTQNPHRSRQRRRATMALTGHLTGPKAPIVSPGGYIPLGSDGKAERQEVHQKWLS